MTTTEITAFANKGVGIGSAAGGVHLSHTARMFPFIQQRYVRVPADPLTPFNSSFTVRQLCSGRDPSVRFEDSFIAHHSPGALFPRMIRVPSQPTMPEASVKARIDQMGIATVTTASDLRIKLNDMPEEIIHDIAEMILGLASSNGRYLRYVARTHYEGGSRQKQRVWIWQTF